jgi:hypothetical protein
MQIDAFRRMTQKQGQHIFGTADGKTKEDVGNTHAKSVADFPAGRKRICAGAANRLKPGAGIDTVWP